MTGDLDERADGLTALFAGAEGIEVASDAEVADWTSSPWTLAALVAVGCVAVTALLVVVIPVAADLIFGWIPQLSLLVS
jgi:hypothetical protein